MWRIGAGAAVVAVGIAGPLIGSALASGGSDRFEGRVLYEDRPCASSKQRTERPLPKAELSLERGGNQELIRLGEDGGFSAKLPGSGPAKARVDLNGGQQVPLVVLERGGKGKHNRWGSSFGKIDPAKRGGNPRELTITDPAEAGAANIWANLYRGHRVLADAGLAVPKAYAYWGARDLPETADVFGSEYKNGAIYIDGDAPRRPGDEWEDWVTLHEFSHHALSRLANPGSPGGEHYAHDTFPHAPALAWSEGFASAFAAAVLGQDKLRFGCRDALNFASSPATPSPDKPQLAAYNEVVNSAVALRLMRMMGGGSARAGIGPFIRTLQGFEAEFGRAPSSLRDVRDALLETGAETNEIQTGEFNDAFYSQGVSWGASLSAGFTGEGAPADPEIGIEVRGPYGTCAPGADHSGTVDGGISWTSVDNCYVYGGDGVPGSGSAAGDITSGGAIFNLPFPYLADRRHLDSTFDVYLTYACRPIDEIECAEVVSVRGHVSFMASGESMPDRAFDGDFEVQLGLGAPPVQVMSFTAAGRCSYVGGYCDGIGG